MVEIKLFLNKDVNENANFYFQKAKKLKAKNPGVEKAMIITNKAIFEFEEKKEMYLQKKEKEKTLEFHRKKEWYDKFRWTKLSSEHLFVIGKDSSTNEILIKKHTTDKDILIHTEAPGSPWGVIINGIGLDKDIIFEAAQYLCCFSSQWKRGFGTADAFWVNTSQVTKKAQSGEYMAKGAFMVYGQKNIIKSIPLKICLGVENKKITTDEGEVFEYDELISSSETSCKKYCKNRFIKLEPGNYKYRNLIKDIKKKLKIHIDELPKYIPNDCKILKK